MPIRTGEPDIIVVGAGLAGLVATYELSQAGRKVLVLDQENRKNLGGQAFWSLLRDSCGVGGSGSIIAGGGGRDPARRSE
jgi:monoamine oxidase